MQNLGVLLLTAPLAFREIHHIAEHVIGKLCVGEGGDSPNPMLNNEVMDFHRTKCFVAHGLLAKNLKKT